MQSTFDPIKTLTRRFVSLPTLVRMQVAAKLLRWREENQETSNDEQRRVPCSCSQPQSFLEKFWDEVEAAHGDELYDTNPFVVKDSQASLYALKDKATATPPSLGHVLRPAVS
jgi:hypothetical protein